MTGILFATSTALYAQNPNAPAPASPQPGQPPMVTPPPNMQRRPMSPGYPPSSPLSVLTEEQRTSYSDAMRAMSPKIMELRSQLAAAHKETFEATLTNKFDEDLIRQKALVEAKIQAEMTVLSAKAFSQIQPPLTTEQIEKIKNPQPMIRPMPQQMPPQPPPAAATNHPPSAPPAQQ
jgi:hypothetical protein